MQTISDAELEKISLQLAKLLKTQEMTLATAESCTGGWLAKCCTDLAGSSSWFDRGFIPYSNQAKHDLLGVCTATLTHFGAVSKQTATEMAQGALTHSNADISVAITGIAGPSGGSDEKPVGHVWFAWAIRNQTVHTELHQFSGDREIVRRQAVLTAIEGIIKNARD